MSLLLLSLLSLVHPQGSGSQERPRRRQPRGQDSRFRPVTWWGSLRQEDNGECRGVRESGFVDLEEWRFYFQPAEGPSCLGDQQISMWLGWQCAIMSNLNLFHGLSGEAACALDGHRVPELQRVYDQEWCVCVRLCMNSNCCICCYSISVQTKLNLQTVHTYLF